LKFRTGFKFRPEDALTFAFCCNIVSRSELLEVIAFVSHNFICFLGQKDQVDDKGHPIVIRVVIPLKSIERVIPKACIVRGM
jgi:hypothetical protein